MRGNDVLLKFLIWRLRNISDKNFILILAGIVGAIAGIAAVVLKSSVHFIQRLLERNFYLYDINFSYLVYPLIGIVITLVISKYVLKEKLGHGITHVLYSISKNSSIIKRSKMYSRMITSAITVGFGGSVGLEAPIVVTGSAIGSNIAQLVHLNYKKRTLLIGCGTAGAISAIFNSPVAGVIFAIEVILADVTISLFIPILIASVTGSLVSKTLLGNDILFSFQLKDSFTAADTPYYILLGVACGLVSLYFTRLTYFVEGKLSGINNDFNRALMGGAALALIILILPPIYGEGYETIKSLLNGNEDEVLQRSLFYGLRENGLIIIFFLFAVMLLKPIASATTIGAGGSGGIFAPSLFLGGVTGYFYARTITQVFPFTNLSLSNFTLVGMCGVMSGVLHAPLTAIFLIAEITSGYTLFVPLMLVSAISYSTISYFEKYSIYTKHLVEKGDLIPNDKDRLVLSQILLEKIVETDLLTIHPNATLDDLVKLVRKSRRNIFPVVNDLGELEGIITLDDVREIMFNEEARKSIIVRTWMTAPPAFVSSNEKMQSVMNKFEISQAWNLPVIDNGKYIGFVSKSSIFSAYRSKLIRQNQEE
ncbi:MULTISPECIES: chloride channel protein [unclassified Imperialibacter]|uniref:chloride channel protein n=1 Tax=unclassified Imperialibacter TaxID=2629706 RepID=UPI00125A2498|nr:MULTISPECIES: chloride channel protein [unclassified Imperialibacter]CAD5270513.1 Chloride channel protein [Imperialibacter sp. 89]CAD5298271.1 Chloride channel protein [Imperialibacter sp. 75]VVT34845.1 Chloride channel protein [Imperialibacter sp. EC-SDR9]